MCHPEDQRQGFHLKRKPSAVTHIAVRNQAAVRRIMSIIGAMREGATEHDISTLVNKFGKRSGRIDLACVKCKRFGMSLD